MLFLSVGRQTNCADGVLTSFFSSLSKESVALNRWSEVLRSFSLPFFRHQYCGRAKKLPHAFFNDPPKDPLFFSLSSEPIRGGVKTVPYFFFFPFCGQWSALVTFFPLFFFLSTGSRPPLNFVPVQFFSFFGCRLLLNHPSFSFFRKVDVDFFSPPEGEHSLYGLRDPFFFFPPFAMRGRSAPFLFLIISFSKEVVWLRRSFLFPFLAG